MVRKFSSIFTGSDYGVRDFLESLDPWFGLKTYNFQNFSLSVSFQSVLINWSVIELVIFSLMDFCLSFFNVTEAPLTPSK